jgi:hypothetical protein
MSEQLHLALDADQLRVGSPRSGAQRGPKGARVGDVIVAEGSRWRVESLNSERREATCRLIGSCILRRFRARAIRDVERAPTSIGSVKASSAVMESGRNSGLSTTEVSLAAGMGTARQR